jgi:hypothetical protein
MPLLNENAVDGKFRWTPSNLSEVKIIVSGDYKQ